jgi:hypothetical protein
MGALLYFNWILGGKLNRTPPSQSASTENRHTLFDRVRRKQTIHTKSRAEGQPWGCPLLLEIIGGAEGDRTPDLMTASLT